VSNDLELMAPERFLSRCGPVSGVKRHVPKLLFEGVDFGVKGVQPLELAAAPWVLGLAEDLLLLSHLYGLPYARA